MNNTMEANLPPSTADHVDDTILKKRGRFRRVNSDPINVASSILASNTLFGNDPIMNDSTTAELLCCLATSSSASYDFDDLRSEVFNKAKAQRLKSRSKDDSDMNLQTVSQDTFVGRFLQDRRNSNEIPVFNKNHNFSAEDENYLLSLLPSISVDTNDMNFGSTDRSILRREFSELSDTADLLKGLSGSMDINQSIGMSGLSDINDLMPPPIMLPSHLGSSSNALDSGRTHGEGIAYAFPTRTLPKKSPSLYMSPARMPLSKAATLNHAMLEHKKMVKEKSLTSAAALNEFGMIQVAPTGQPTEEVTNQSQSVSDISTVPSGSLGSSSTSSGAAMHVSGGSGNEQTSPPQHYNSGVKNSTSNPKKPHRSSKSLSQIDSASGDPSAFDALLQHFRNRSDSQRSLNSSSWSINSGISSMSIGDLTRSSDTAPHQHVKGSKNYPRLVQLLTADSRDEMEKSTTDKTAGAPNTAAAAVGTRATKNSESHSGGGALHNSHAAAHGGHHNANSHIVHHHVKESHHGSAQKQKLKRHETLKRQDGLSPTNRDATSSSWLDTSSNAAAAPFQAQQQQMQAPLMGGAVPVTTMGADNTPYTTYYVPVSGAGAVASSVYPSAMDPNCMPCAMPSPEYQYSNSNGGTPRNCFPGSLSVTSESYSYNAGMPAYSAVDDSSISAAMNSLSYGRSNSSSSGGEHLSNPALNSYVSNFNSAGAGYYSVPNGSISFNNFNPNPMASSNTLSYLAEIKGENNLFKEKPKPQRYVGRSNYRCGKCGMPKVNHVCSIVDTLITGVETQTVQPAWDPKGKPIATERVLTISKRKNITDEFDYDDHHNRYNITQPRRDIFAKKLAQQQAAQRQLEMQQMQAALSMYSADGYSPTNYQQQLMYQELLARTRSNSTLYTSSQSQYSSYNSTPSVTPTAAAAVAKMAINNSINANVGYGK